MRIPTCRLFEVWRRRRRLLFQGQVGRRARKETREERGRWRERDGCSSVVGIVPAYMDGLLPRLVYVKGLDLLAVVILYHE